MMCAHSTPLAADVPAAQHALDNILDGGPSVLGAILHCLYTLLTLVAVTAIICIYQTVIAQVRYRREVR